ncbi:MAG: glycosyltransferase [Thermoguttaceae bacterium]|nr:glycosyltransferase family 1 protein [Planctomycetaceae bacterium]MBQ4144651.1 glycosyltransferase [Thermoguttaceae bacterium]
MAAFLIFSDDWGRHPSSCQHLMRCLMESGEHRVFWVNTIGTRPPRLDLLTLRRGVEKIRSWVGTVFRRERKRNVPTGNFSEIRPEKILQPLMFPWFRSRFDRHLNRTLLAKQLRRALKGETDVTAVTTLPITADLPGTLPCVTRWVYYCVDDWSRWPGMDAEPLEKMESLLVQKADKIVTAGENLRDRLLQMGRDSLLLTHGVDLDLWQKNSMADENGKRKFTKAGISPTFVFWGLIDERLEPEMLERLASDAPECQIVLAGPVASPEMQHRLEKLPSVRFLGPLPPEELPKLASEADVLLMPYRKNEATEQIQPLKMTEYLASGKPAVVRGLRAAQNWADALDIADTPEHFSHLARIRAENGIPETQRAARKRLENETWKKKARDFEAFILE